MFIRKSLGQKGTGPFSDHNLGMIELSAKKLAGEIPDLSPDQLQRFENKTRKMLA